MFPHEEDGDSGGEAAEAGGREGGGLRWEVRADGGEVGVWCCGGDVVPGAGVG